MASGRRGTNLPRMGDYNLQVVLDRVRRAPDGVSRIELAAETGLSVQTISNLVARLLEAGTIVEGARRVTGRGKPRTMLHVRAEAAHAVGVHIDPIYLATVLIDLAGTVVARTVDHLPGDVEGTVALIAERAAGLLDHREVEHLYGLGIAAPGPIDVPGGRLVNPPLLEWGEVPLRDLVAHATGLRTMLEKDVTAGLAASIWQQPQALRGTTLFTYLGYGIGFAFAHHGELLTGASGNAGETGHIIVDADGPACWCGNRGCLGISSSMEYLVEQAGVLGLLEPLGASARPPQVEERMQHLAALASDGDSTAVELLATAGRRIARGVLLVSDLVDADRVVVGGANWERMRAYVEPAVREQFRVAGTVRELHGVVVDGTELGLWVGAVGAASFVLDSILSPHASILTSSA